ncbi:MAG: glycosyltransferase [Gammaproteobacteria bacterium]|nr:glycosyltransferase [Gammaproteobacteria bacterium]
MTDDPAGGEVDKDALSRLRRENNRLRREIAALRVQAANEAGRRDARERALETALDDITGSTLWRWAVIVRDLGVYRVLSALRGRAGGEALEPGARRAGQYQAYVAATALTPDKRRALAARARELEHRPLISVVMPVHNTAPELLASAVASVFNQVYEHWELCIADDASDRPETLRALEGIDDPRVRLRRLDRRHDIAGATNEAIGLVGGEYIAFLDHDDRLAPDALLEAALEINHSGADFIYTDEDYLDASGARVNPHFKPGFSPDLLLSHNYITHLVVASRDLVERAGPLRPELSGAQDYDFVLRATEIAARVRRIPKVLYHWRMSDTSTAGRAESKPRAAERGVEALRAALERRGRSGTVTVDPEVPHFYHVRYALEDEPLISIIIPFRDRSDLLHCVIGDVLETSTWGNFEIVGISNDSVEPETFEAMRDLSALDARVRFAEYNAPFSYSAIVNHGAGRCAGEHLVLLNNDIRIMSADWLQALLEHSQREEVGAVGGKLYYPDGRIQHAGIVVGIDEYAGHSHKGFPSGHQGYFNRLRVVQNVSAVTGAFMMVEKRLFETVGGFDEDRFAVACNDVDFCLRLRERGLWNVFTPHAEAWHIESASRGYEDSPEKKQRYARERQCFVERHRAVLESGDPFYNPNLTSTAEDFSLRELEAQR